MHGCFFIYFAMLEDLVGADIASIVGDEKDVAEVRMRISRPLLICNIDGTRRVGRHFGLPYVVSKSDVDGVLSRATNMSLYSASDEMKRGYIPCGRYRIGVGGEGVFDTDNYVAVKNISYLVIRIPHQIKGVADKIVNDVFAAGKALNTLVVSPTGGGKTTLLRELARIASRRFNVVVIDERYELCACNDGMPTLDVEDAEVISGVPKRIAYQNCVRAMNPDIIVTDELFGSADVIAICDVIRSGVTAFASLHGDSVESVMRNEIYKPLFDSFDFAVVLCKVPVGEICQKVRL